MCAFVALDLVFFPYQAKRLAWGNVSEMTRFVSSGMYNRNSINQSKLNFLAVRVFIAEHADGRGSHHMSYTLCLKERLPAFSAVN